METSALALEKMIVCPNCGSDAVYKYGKTPGGKQKYQCIVCDRQFVENTNRKKIDDRPACPECGEPMHLYMRQKGATRFRCSKYPECRTFVKIDKEV